MGQDGIPYSIMIFFLLIILGVLSFIGLIVTLIFMM
jgi:hypothetical protein